MDRTKTMPWTVEEMINLYEKTDSGYFFSPDAMSFFKSRVLGDFRRLDDKNGLFITTERGPNGRRSATVRRVKIVDRIRDDGDTVSCLTIETIKPYNELTVYKARKLMKELEFFKVFHIETKVVELWTLSMILLEINRDRSQDWTPYDETDWTEGLEYCTEYRLIEEIEQ